MNLTKKIINPRRVQGFVPFWKDKNDHCKNIFEWIKLHLNFDLYSHDKYFNFAWRYNLQLPINFSGITMIALQGNCVQKSKCFKFLYSNYNIKMKLGSSTTTGEGTFGTINKTAPYDHITESFIQEKLKGIKGHMMLLSELDAIHDPNYKPMIEKLSHHEILDNLSDEKDKVVAKRLRMINPLKKFDIKSVELTKFDPPYFDINVEASLSFHSPIITKLIEKEISCPNHIIDCERYKLEFVTKDHCIQKHTMMLEDMMKAAHKVTGGLEKLLNQHADKIEFKKLTAYKV